MNEFLKTISELSSIDAPSGREKQITDRIENFLKNSNLHTQRDYFDNIAGIIEKGKGKTLLFTAHIDQILCYVKNIDKGYILIDTRMTNKNFLKGKEVYLITGKGKFKGIIGMIPPHLKGKDKDEYLYVDVGFYSPEEIGVKPGDTVVFASKQKNLSENVISAKSLDNRASVCVLLELSKELKDIPFKGKIILYFSVQEEISGLGASVIVKRFKPDLAICLDVTFAKAFGDPDTHIELNKGPVIAKGPFISGKLSDLLIEVAKREEIPYQIEVLERYTGTDLDGFFSRDGGVPSALVSIPLRYMHSPTEVIDLRDLKRTKKLLIYFIKEIMK